MVERVIDGIKLKMVSAVGEADDEIYVWLEDDQKCVVEKLLWMLA